MAIHYRKKDRLKNTVIRLLSGFPVLPASLTAHVSISSRSGDCTSNCRKTFGMAANRLGVVGNR
jgi:hypothetical protein